MLHPSFCPNSNGEPQPSYIRDLDSEDEEETTDNGDDDDDAPSWANIPHFPELQQRIQDTIDDLGGIVFPKLNWSSPKVRLLCYAFLAFWSIGHRLTIATFPTRMRHGCR
jgi:hypothetical protein